MGSTGYQYSVLRFCRNLSREEFINIGILFATDDYIEFRVNPDSFGSDNFYCRYVRALKEIVPELYPGSDLSWSGVTNGNPSFHGDNFEKIKEWIRGEDAPLSWSDNKCGILLEDTDEERVDQLYKELVLPPDDE